MINDVLAFVSFGAFLLELLFSSSVLPRLLGVYLNFKSMQSVSVSYTHLDVYKRQPVDQNENDDAQRPHGNADNRGLEP